MIGVAWHPLSRRELFEGVDFYEEETLGLGEIFLDRVERAVALIRAFPQSGPFVRGEVRKRRVTRFPYDLIYRIERDRIFILAAAHHKRRPYYWARRR